MRRVLDMAAQFRLLALAALLAGAFVARTAGSEVTGTQPPDLLTNLLQLRQQAGHDIPVLHRFRIEASVVAVDASQGVLALRDESGVEFIRAGFTNGGITPGATVRFEGMGCRVGRQGPGLVLVPGKVVENDGIHGTVLESGRVFLKAGANPVKLAWFNRYGALALGVEYEGPNLPRQPIPDDALSRAVIDAATGRTNFLEGLNYRGYEGDWEFLPDFGRLQPVTNGTAANFNADVRTRNETVGLEFDGFIQVPRDGVYAFHVASDDGSRLFAGTPTLDVHLVREGPAPVAVEPLSPHSFATNKHPWVMLEGTVNSIGAWEIGGELRLRVGDDDIRVEVFDGQGALPHVPQHGRVRVTGIYEGVLSNEGQLVPGRLLVLNWAAIQPIGPQEQPGGVAGGEAASGAGSGADVPATNGPQTLLTGADVKALSTEQAREQRPVSIRGVVTAFTAKHLGAVIQDSTRGVFVDLLSVRGAEPVRRGGFYQIDGVTGPGLFAPIVVAGRITPLGPGQLPPPVRATWDRLMNGSLDTEYVEIDGIVTDVEDHRIVLLVQGGKILVELDGFQSEALRSYEEALVRIQGCCFANFNRTTRKFEPGSVTVSGATVEILEPAPPDPFDAPGRGIGELLLYDSTATPFRRSKVSGQVVYSRAGEHYLTDGTNGVYVITRAAESLGVGDLADAVGFLELAGHAAQLKEALVRKTGHAPLPPATKLPPEDLLLTRYAGTPVQVEATLINSWSEASDLVLELQSGFLVFRARMGDREPSFALPPKGSRLELTGVHSPQGTGGEGGMASGLELLLSLPQAVHVLSTPPWWTLRRVLILAGLLAALLLGVLIWNKELHWKVQKRGQQLEAEIQSRQQVELERAAEAERARIARDLHDELGTGLTEVSLLSSASLGEFRDGAKHQERFRLIAEKARDLVSNLDIIVWAVNPKHNTLQSLADYIESYARELLSASGIVCRCRIPVDCGSVALSGTERHSLLLAIKETLNNVIRHAAATVVELQMFHPGDLVKIVIADNGRGFDWGAIRRGNGLTNLQERTQHLGGRCEIESQPGKGTRVTLIVPLHGRAGVLMDSTETHGAAQ